MLKRFHLGEDFRFHVTPTVCFNAHRLAFCGLLRGSNTKGTVIRRRRVGATCVSSTVSLVFTTRQFGGRQPCIVTNVGPVVGLGDDGSSCVGLGGSRVFLRLNMNYSFCVPFFGLHPRLGFVCKLASSFSGGRPRRVGGGGRLPCTLTTGKTRDGVVTLAFCFR